MGDIDESRTRIEAIRVAWRHAGRMCVAMDRMDAAMRVRGGPDPIAYGRAWADLRMARRDYDAAIIALVSPQDTPREMIATAAIRVDGEVWALPRPARHHIITRAWSDAYYYRDGKLASFHAHDSGFMTSTGRFVDREEAEAIARASGQISGDLIGGVLTSEDLW